MKKIISITLALCFLTTLFCMTAIGVSAAGPTVMTVSGQQKGGGAIIIGTYDNLETGWDTAMELADDEDFMNDYAFDRIVIDFHADWNANEDGEFGRSSLLGFQYSTIYIPEEVRVTINLNNKTINRGLSNHEYDGEVIYIDEEADVIINNGTIAGGNSYNGAGGIHIKDDANVTLNDVHIVGNTSYEDHGGGIALYDGAELVMNRGSFTSNRIKPDERVFIYNYGAAIYAEDAKATFCGVEFRDNQFIEVFGFGAAIYAYESDVYIQDCIFDSNGTCTGANSSPAVAVVYAEDSSMKIANSTFINNGNYSTHKTSGVFGIGVRNFVSSVITLDNSSLEIRDNCKFTNNKSMTLFDVCWGSQFLARNSTFTDNESCVIYYVDSNEDDDIHFENCTFNNNQMRTPVSIFEGSYKPCAFEVYGEYPISLLDCELGDSTYNDKYLVGIFDTGAPNGVGSILGEGSLTMIIAILALGISVASIGTTIALNKGKKAPATANNTSETKNN